MRTDSGATMSAQAILGACTAYISSFVGPEHADGSETSPLVAFADSSSYSPTKEAKEWITASAVARVQACEVVRTTVRALRTGTQSPHVADSTPAVRASTIDMARRVVVGLEDTHVRERVRQRKMAVSQFIQAEIAVPHDIGISLHAAAVGRSTESNPRLATLAQSDLDRIWADRLLPSAAALLRDAYSDDEYASQFVLRSITFADAINEYLLRSARYLLMDDSVPEPSNAAALPAQAAGLPGQAEAAQYLSCAVDAGEAEGIFLADRSARSNAARSESDVVTDTILPSYLTAVDIGRLATLLFSSGRPISGEETAEQRGMHARARCVRVLLDGSSLLQCDILSHCSPACLTALAQTVDLTRVSAPKSEKQEMRSPNEIREGVHAHIDVGIAIAATVRLFGYAPRPPLESDVQIVRSGPDVRPGIPEGWSPDPEVAPEMSVAEKVASQPYLIGTQMSKETAEDISAYRGAPVTIDRDMKDAIRYGQDVLWPPETTRPILDGREPIDGDEKSVACPGEIPGFPPRPADEGPGLPRFAGWLVPAVSGAPTHVASWYRVIGAWPSPRGGSVVDLPIVVAELEPAGLVEGIAPPEILVCKSLIAQGGNPARGIILRARTIDVVADQVVASEQAHGTTTDPTLSMWGMPGMETEAARVAIQALVTVDTSREDQSTKSAIAREDAILRYLAPGGQERSILCMAALSLAAYVLHGGDGDIASGQPGGPFVIVATDTERDDVDAQERRVGLESDMSRNVLRALDYMFLFLVMDREADLLAEEGGGSA